MYPVTIKALKNLLPSGELLTKAMQGSLTFLWRPHNAHTIAPSLQEVAEAPTDVMVHMSLLYLRPWRPTWTLVTKVGDGAAAQPCVQATNTGPSISVLTHFELLERLDTKKAWSVFMLPLLEGHYRDHPFVFSGHFNALHLQNSSRALGPHCVWEGYRQEAQPPVANWQAPPAAGNDGGDDAAVSDGEDDDSDVLLEFEEPVVAASLHCTSSSGSETSLS